MKEGGGAVYCFCPEEQRAVGRAGFNSYWDSKGESCSGNLLSLEKNAFFPDCEIQEVMHMLRLAIVICFITGENVLDIYCEKS